MDKANQAGQNAPAGISIRNGPVEEMDLDGPTTNGNSKRKVRGSMGNGQSYKEVSDEDEDKPLVCHYSRMKRNKQRTLILRRVSDGVFRSRNYNLSQTPTPTISL